MDGSNAARRHTEADELGTFLAVPLTKMAGMTRVQPRREGSGEVEEREERESCRPRGRSCLPHSDDEGATSGQKTSPPAHRLHNPIAMAMVVLSIAFVSGA